MPRKKVITDEMMLDFGFQYLGSHAAELILRFARVLDSGEPGEGFGQP